jgi:hypothetical protein
MNPKHKPMQVLLSNWTAVRGLNHRLSTLSAVSAAETAIIVAFGSKDHWAASQ